MGTLRDGAFIESSKDIASGNCLPLAFSILTYLEKFTKNALVILVVGS